jgi:hypothetical protein
MGRGRVIFSLLSCETERQHRGASQATHRVHPGPVRSLLAATGFTGCRSLSAFQEKLRAGFCSCPSRLTAQRSFLGTEKVVGGEGASRGWYSTERAITSNLLGRHALRNGAKQGRSTRPLRETNHDGLPNACPYGWAVISGGGRGDLPQRTCQSGRTPRRAEPQDALRQRLQTICVEEIEPPWAEEKRGFCIQTDNRCHRNDL